MADPKPPYDVNPATNPSAAGPPAPKPKPKKKKDGNPFGTPPPVVGAKKKQSNYTQFHAWASKQGINDNTTHDIWYWSQHTPNVDPYLWTSVLMAESGVKHVDGNGKIISSGQAVGIGQIALSWIGQPIPWDKHHKFTADDNHATGIANYGVNIRMSAYLWGYGVSQFGWQKAYEKSYNPNDPGRHRAWLAIQATYNTRPAGHPPIGSPSQGPADTTPGSQTGGTTTPVPFKDAYITGVMKGKDEKFSTTNDPNKALQYNGAPLTRSAFLTLKAGLTSHYVSYTGGRPSNQQIVNFVTKGWSDYQLDVLLSKSKKFHTSPVAKQFRANFQAAVQDLLPKGGKIPDELLREAVVNRWTADALATHLRKLPTYTKSNEFTGKVASLLNIHTSIMGNPNAGALIGVKDAALNGWSADQYANYLRSQPAYQESPEYQTKALSIMGALGLITGGQAVLAKGVGPGPGSLGVNAEGKLPNDPRTPGNHTLTDPLDLGSTIR